MSDGILVGTDNQQEWMLKIWWKSYCAHNTLPVAFVDFGMTAGARLFCQNRGVVIDVPDVQIALRDEICPIRARFWDRIYPGPLWDARPVWFRKPAALLESPFDRTLWIDLDALVVRKLGCSPFNNLDTQELSLVRASAHVEQGSRLVGLYHWQERCYNAGVIAFRRNSRIVKLWAEQTTIKTDQFLGDEHLLNRILWHEGYPLNELDPTYNHSCFEREQAQAMIIHFCGQGGKLQLIHRLQV